MYIVFDLVVLSFGKSAIPDKYDYQFFVNISEIMCGKRVGIYEIHILNMLKEMMCVLLSVPLEGNAGI